MGVGVVGELVPAVGDALRHVGVGVEPVAHDERRHLHVPAVEHVEQLIGEVEVAVGVERERDPGLGASARRPRSAPADAGVVGGVVGAVAVVAAVGPVGAGVVAAAPSLAPPSPPQPAARAPSAATAPARNVRRGTGEEAPGAAMCG